MIKKLTNSNNVCTAGGSFLNCNSNEIIINSGLFENTFFVPPADDSGIPLGCAWYAYQQVAEIQQTFPLWPYFGKKYSNRDVEEATSKFPNLRVEYWDNFDDIVETITDRLIENKVIGWFQGGSEIGPRALGNRSIIASPTSKWMKDRKKVWDRRNIDGLENEIKTFFEVNIAKFKPDVKERKKKKL